MTFPSGEAQEQLLHSLYQMAGVDPASLEYIEAHGTGTKVKAPPSPTTTGGPLAAALRLCPRRWETPRS